MAQGNIQHVVIIGGGPVGMLTALMLGQLGINVEVFEKGIEIDDRPRGAAYGPSAVQVLRRAGVIAKLRDRGITPNGIAWREHGGKIITGISRLDSEDDPDRVLVLQVHLVTKALCEEVDKISNVKIYYNHEFKGLTQADDQVTVELKSDTGTKHISADFVIGCDGARSDVRKALFGRSFPGRTWDTQIVATNVKYDGFKKHGWCDVSWTIHPEHWVLCARLDNEDTWRVAYGDKVGLDPDQLRCRVAEKFRIILPGNPKEGEYELVNWSPFTLHQRCAEKMCVGRVLLAGDAAHLNNPIGGLGLTGGIADVGSLVDALQGIHEGATTTKILEKYDEERRRIFRTWTDPVSTANLERLFKDASTVMEHDIGLQTIEKASHDPAAAAYMRTLELSLSSDLTPFYDIKAQ